MSWRRWVYTLDLEPVREALSLGWRVRLGSYKSRAHFHFDGPVPFSVDWKWNQVGYTIRGETVFSDARAVELLRAAVIVSNNSARS